MFTRSRLISESTTTPTTSDSLRVHLDSLIMLLNSNGKILNMETMNELSDKLRALKESEENLIKDVETIKEYINIMDKDPTIDITLDHMKEFRSTVGKPTVRHMIVNTPVGVFPVQVTEYKTPSTSGTFTL